MKSFPYKRSMNLSGLFGHLMSYPSNFIVFVGKKIFFSKTPKSSADDASIPSAIKSVSSNVNPNFSNRSLNSFSKEKSGS